jgi:hypothetical protein
MFTTIDLYVPVQSGIGFKEPEKECMACTELAQNGYQLCALVNSGVLYEQ